VLAVWSRFYGVGKRGKRLEVDRKDNREGYSLENCVLACAICNCAKSDQFSYQEFKAVVGPAIRKVWEARKKEFFRRRISDPNMTVYRDGKVLFDIEETEW